MHTTGKRRPPAHLGTGTGPSPSIDQLDVAAPHVGALDELMTWPPDAQLPCPTCGRTTQGLLDRGTYSPAGGLIVRTEALPCGCDVSDQVQQLQAAAVEAGYILP